MGERGEGVDEGAESCAGEKALYSIIVQYFWLAGWRELKRVDLRVCAYSRSMELGNAFL
jgi:hypothetical protein